MSACRPLARALCLLLALLAMLPVAVRSASWGCGTTAAEARDCCCAPAAPDCLDATTARVAADNCGCCAQPEPVVPAERTAVPQLDAAVPAAVPPGAGQPLSTGWSHGTAAVPLPALRPAGCVLLRLNCVNLI